MLDIKPIPAIKPVVADAKPAGKNWKGDGWRKARLESCNPNPNPNPDPHLHPRPLRAVLRYTLVATVAW